MNDIVDVLVIGGGAAGLSGALTLARARRSVVVLDSGEPRNAPADGVHGFLSRDGIAPRDLLDIGAAEVTGYGGRIHRSGAVWAKRADPGFLVGAEDGRTYSARRLLITTGLVDELPEIPGLRERFGRDVLHCPYCHGWEIQDRPLGIIGSGPQSVHHALLFRQWSKDVVLLAHTMEAPEPEQAEQLAALGIPVIDGEIIGLDLAADRLTGVRLASGRTIAREALAVAPRFTARGEILTGLGLAPAEHPFGSRIESDPTGLTAVPGVWVAGNVTDHFATVVGAAAGGVMAAAAINADLIAEDTRRAVAELRDPFSARNEAAVARVRLLMVD